MLLTYYLLTYPVRSACKPAAALSVLRGPRCSRMRPSCHRVCGRGCGPTQGCSLQPNAGLQPAAQHRVAACSRTSAGVLDGATHVYMANLCFPEALNHAMTAALAAVSLPRARPRAGYLPATYRTVSPTAAASGSGPTCAATQRCNPALQPSTATLHCNLGVPEAATGCMGGRSPAHRSRTPYGTRTRWPRCAACSRCASCRCKRRGPPTPRRAGVAASSAWPRRAWA